MNEQDRKKPEEQKRLDDIRARRLEKQASQSMMFPLQSRTTYSTYRQADRILDTQKNEGKSLNSRWVSGILSILLAVMLGAFSWMDQFRIHTPAITGSTEINIDEIIYYAGLHNRPVFEIDPDAIQNTLLKRYPELRSVKVSVSLPAKMAIELEPNIAVIKWDFGGSHFWIDQDGQVLNETKNDTDAVYVLANSFPGAKNPNDRNIPQSFTLNTLHSILHISKYVPKGKTLYYTYDNGFGWDTDNGWRFFIGTNDVSIDEKMAMEDSLTKYFKKEEIEPVMVSLEFKNAPYYQLAE